MISEPISKILSRRINAMGLARQVSAARVCAAANELAAGEFEAVSFREGILKLHVDSAPRAHLIKLREKQILDELNLKLAPSQVRKLVFKID